MRCVPEKHNYSGHTNDLSHVLKTRHINCTLKTNRYLIRFFFFQLIVSTTICEKLLSSVGNLYCSFNFPEILQNRRQVDNLVNHFKIFKMNMSDLDRQIEVLRRCEVIKESEVKALCSKAREILVEESNVQRVDSPVTVSSS